MIEGERLGRWEGEIKPGQISEDRRKKIYHGNARIITENIIPKKLLQENLRFLCYSVKIRGGKIKKEVVAI
jgi:hypothetical protein